MRARSRILTCWLGCACVCAVTMAAGAATATAAAPVCGTATGPPGVLVGTYNSNVIVEGTCLVNSGLAVVRGNLTVMPGGTLVAAFGLNHRGASPAGSSLRINGNLIGQAGATLLVGCTPRSFPCIDDTGKPPTLSSRTRVFGNLTSAGTLSTIVHNDTINGNVSQTGGGGGFNCEPEEHEAFSAYEDTTINGNVTVQRLESCWLGLNRLRVQGNVRIVENRLFNKDAIEILANHIGGNLACRENSMVWNSAEESFGSLFPRIPMPNTVNGKRSGQCVLASPETEGGPLGPGPF